jgi:hypothetical protein
MVPDHRERQPPGASFEGFYYIALNKRTGTVDGVYYAHNCASQELRLYHVAERTMETFTFM